MANWGVETEAIWGTGREKREKKPFIFWNMHLKEYVLGSIINPLQLKTQVQKHILSSKKR